jgi:pachytene checkpoint protein 2
MMRRLEEVAQHSLHALHRQRISNLRERLVLPVVGETIVKFDQIPQPGKDVRFHIIFSLPAFDQAESNVVTEDDKKIFSEATRLPREDWTQYWERIYLDESIKDRALNYCLLAQTLRRYEVSRMTLAQHRIMVFYGPPGTGKTTLVRGLANKVAHELRLRENRPTFFVEIKAHALSTVDLGGGPKLVAQAFGRVEDLASSGHTVICFIDEVESLLTNRTMTLNEANPVDVFRSVNAVFQQIDRLAERSNVFTFATSNLPKAIDRAFSDRADMLFFIDFPDEKLRYLIFCDIFAELNQKLKTSFPIGPIGNDPKSQADWQKLLLATDGFSGRHLRKLVLEAMTKRKEVSFQPELLSLEDITNAALDNQKRTQRDIEHGGTYEYAYRDSTLKGEKTHE